MKIYQIYYDEASKGLIDPAFIPYDNSSPADKSWYEYSAIRKIIANTSFLEDEYIGIFSPRFTEKTGLSGKNIIDAAKSSKAEVISFSPKFSRIALFNNSYLQGDL